MIAYHFVGAALRDGRPVPADGEWLVHEGEAVLCESGLHASRHPMDALYYAPGVTLCLVECEDIVSEEGDKLVCRRRRIIKRIDATELLRKASRQFALSVIHLWDAPAVVREFLETGDESKRAATETASEAAARAAADAAADAAARAASWAAARDATETASMAASWAAAETASWDASWAAAWAAAWGAAEAAAEITARAAAWGAAEAAARAAAGAAAEITARAAARAAHRETFADLVNEALERSSGGSDD